MTGSAIRTPDHRLRVFVSSTLGELADERRAVRSAVEQLRLSPVMFELGARPHPPRALYRSYLEQSDVFVGIYHQSYGWVAPDMDVSGLEDELLLSEGLPRLVYVKRPAPDMAPRLREMLARLRGEDTTSYKPFADADELRQLVLDDLSLMLTERFTATAAPTASPGPGAARTPAAPPQAPLPPPTSFVGREAALDRLRDDLRGGASRLLTLVGPGGTGKTRLALEAAAGLGADFPQGVVVVDLSSEHDPERVPADVVRAVAPVAAADAPPLVALEEGLREARMLLVLDNFEQVTAAAPQVAHLVQRCPRLSVLVTSRESLRVRGETVVRVPPLALPDVDAHDVDAVAGAPAVRLFLDRAAEAAPGFALGPDNLEDVAAVCRRLDGLPLAIELAAARLRLFSVAELRDRLGHGLDELRGGARDLPERQQALRRTIEWSVSLLDDDERTLLAALSAFSGARLLDVEAVAASVPTLTRLDVVEGTASLLDKSLVQGHSPVSGRPRFVLLETIRAYAAELLAARPALAREVRRAHAEHYTRLAGEWRHGFGPGRREEVLASLGDEHGNLRAAWSWWVAAGDVARMNDLLELLWGYYDAHGAYHEAVALGDDLLGVLAMQPETPERVRDEIAMQTSMARSMIAVRGYTAEVERRIEAALTRADEGSEDGDRPTPRFPALRALGTLHLLRAEFERGREVSEELLAVASRLEDPTLLADAHQLAGITEMSRDIAGSLQHFDASISLFESSPPPRVQFRIGPQPGVVSHVISGLLLWLTGFPERARRRVERGLDLARRSDHPYTCAYALFHASLLGLWQQDLAEVADHAEELRQVAKDHDYPIWSALALVLAGTARIGSGSASEGLAEVERGFALYGTLATPPVFWSSLLMIRASGCFTAGDLEEAERYLDEAAEALWEGDPTEAELEVRRGDLRLARADRQAASASFERAASLAESLGARMTRVQALTRLATLHATPEAVDRLREALGEITEGLDSPAFAEASRLLTASSSPTSPSG
jgi:predicted ATPase